MSAPLTARPAHELRGLIARGEVSAVEVAQAHLDRIAAVDGAVRAFLTPTPDLALAAARRVDDRRARGEELPPLAGVPVALKDNLCTRGVATTCGSRILEGYVPPHDATVVSRLAERGAVVVGKANLDEFAMGSSTENSAYFPTRNPWDLGRVPGGSSGGSAAAVAGGMAALALGSDTGGSVRQPAALCGIVGMKPTYGRVSRFGLVAFASSLDQIGPFGRDVRDAALLLQAVAGHDPHDSTSAPVEVPDYQGFLGRDIRGLRVGVPREYFGEGIEPGVEEAVRAAIRVLAGLGAEIEECSLPHTPYALDVYYVIAPAEASSNLARYDGVRYGPRVAGGGAREQGAAARPNSDALVAMYEATRGAGFGREVKRRIMIGTYALSAGYYDAYYKKAQQVRTLVRRDFDQAFLRYDVLVSPTSPTVAFPLGTRTADPLAMYLADVCTIPAPLAGLPAISVPCGFSAGLPVGLQFTGRPFDEGRLLQVAYAYEQAAGFAGRRPPEPGRGAGRS